MCELANAQDKGEIAPGVIETFARLLEDFSATLKATHAP